MNKNKIQLEICKALLKGCINVSGCELGDEKYAITPDGFRVFIFKNDELIINLGKVKHSDISAYLIEDPRDVEIAATDRCLLMGDDLIAEYCGEGLEIYINAAFAKSFEGCVFLGYSPTQRVLVKDKSGDVLGMIIPVRDAGIRMEKKNALGE